MSQPVKFDVPFRSQLLHYLWNPTNFRSNLVKQGVFFLLAGVGIAAQIILVVHVNLTVFPKLENMKMFLSEKTWLG